MSGQLSMRFFCALLVLLACPLLAQDHETKVRQDRQRFLQDSRWIYNDIDLARRTALESEKPLLVIFRCVPCEACSQFDKQVIEEQDNLQQLLDQFVCARVIHANGLDLELFQFDFDQSFHAVIMHGDTTIYGRFGTRSHRPEEEDMTLESFRAGLLAALELHRGYASNRARLAGKRQSDVQVTAPEKYPSLEGKFESKLDYEGQIVSSCIRCHQVREAERLVYRTGGEPIPEKELFPYPLPDVLGLRMDPQNVARVTAVQEGSWGHLAGLQAGDDIREMADQPLISIADLQWILHQAADTARISMRVIREDRPVDLVLELPEGWRRKSDISFRASTWDLRRMALGGMRLEEDSRETTAEPRQVLPEPLPMRLHVRHVGADGEHAAAKRAGIQPGDVVIGVEDQSARMTESELIDYILGKPRGSRLRFRVLRDGRERLFTIVTR